MEPNEFTIMIAVFFESISSGTTSQDIIDSFIKMYCKKIQHISIVSSELMRTSSYIIIYD